MCRLRFVELRRGEMLATSRLRSHSTERTSGNSFRSVRNCMLGSEREWLTTVCDLQTYASRACASACESVEMAVAHQFSDSAKMRKAHQPERHSASQMRHHTLDTDEVLVVPECQTERCGRDPE